MLHLLGGVALARQQHAAQAFHPQVYHLIGSPLLVLVRCHLIAQSAQHIAVEDAGQCTAGQRQGHLEAAVLFQTREVQAGHRNLRIARLDQCLAQQMNVVGSTAATAGLGDEQRSMLQIVLAAVQRVQKLTDDQQSRIAGVVVDVFQAQLCHGTAAVAQNFALVAVVTQSVLQQAELGNGHVGDEDGVGLLHLRSKFGIIVFHRFLLCCFLKKLFALSLFYSAFSAATSSRSSRAANRLRRRIFTAPRLVISSILSWV